MTERLYYTDSTLVEFTAQIVARKDNDRGPAVQLDRTAFYPTSGGQPHDAGAIDGIAVRDVWEDDAGAVWHLLDRVPERDDVRGTIDWERRFDHMQQHTGQHLLSAGFVRLLDAPTVSFHLGTDDSTIDLDTPELSWDSAFRVEADVNSVIWEDRPVEVHTVDQEDIHTVPLRRPPKVSGTIRVIWVRDYDAAACGGTHVVRTGAIGLLKITRIERYKSGVRVGFLCGGRALRHYQRSLLHLQSASTSLSVHPDQLGEAIQRLQDDLRETRRASRAAQNAVMAFEAQRLWTDTPEVGGVRRVVEFLDDRSYDEARAAASHLSNQPRTLALLAVNDAKGVRMVCERSRDVPNLDAASILLRAAEALGGRAGGTASLAQGGAPARARDVVVEALRAAAASAR